MWDYLSAGESDGELCRVGRGWGREAGVEPRQGGTDLTAEAELARRVDRSLGFQLVLEAQFK